MRPVVRLCVRACAVAAVLMLTLLASVIAHAQQPHEIAMQYFVAGRYHEAVAIYQQLAEQHRRSGDATKYTASHHNAGHDLQRARAARRGRAAPEGSPGHTGHAARKGSRLVSSGWATRTTRWRPSTTGSGVSAMRSLTTVKRCR